jgi:hypothetical protein
LVLMLRCKLLWCLHYRSRYVNNNNNNNHNAVHSAVWCGAFHCPVSLYTIPLCEWVSESHPGCHGYRISEVRYHLVCRDVTYSLILYILRSVVLRICYLLPTKVKG